MDNTGHLSRLENSHPPLDHQNRNISIRGYLILFTPMFSIQNLCVGRDWKECCFIYGSLTVTGQNPRDMYPPDTCPKDMCPPVTYPLDTYLLGNLPPGHLPPGHLPPGHLPPRTYTPVTYTPQTLKCPIWFMHHVLITYCTLKSISFAEIAFICDIGAIKLTDICSARKD